VGRLVSVGVITGQVRRYSHIYLLAGGVLFNGGSSYVSNTIAWLVGWGPWPWRVAFHLVTSCQRSSGLVTPVACVHDHDRCQSRFTPAHSKSPQQAGFIVNDSHPVKVVTTLLYLFLTGLVLLVVVYRLWTPIDKHVN